MRSQFGRTGGAHKTERGRAASPSAGRVSDQRSGVPPHMADVLALQRSAGNAATAQALTVQRAGASRHDDSDDSGLAYGSDHGTPPPEQETSFTGVVGGVQFTSKTNGPLMRRVHALVRRVAPHMGQQLAAAGSVSVQLGRTRGGTPGEWRQDSRTIVLDQRLASADHLTGTAVFEILNASSRHRIAALEAEVAGGGVAARARAKGWDHPEKFFAMEVERIEWENGMTHKAAMASAGLSGTPADLFGQEGGFVEFYNRQVASGHTHSYEFRYNLLRAQADAAAAREQEAAWSHGGPPDESSSHRPR
ncbi:hypothetical protein [Streptomyces lonarensis]|uniref:Uncharacterized protein n=1 Tax=Streptomyces lonarensis TaxID=700599 RepID=A0A7X6CYJ0_9ACTN|nr:hypothetical protein [Streptomyces lonarensis]NJQ04774.1 hypothetical protein [Streptomyces lonarensis]